MIVAMRCVCIYAVLLVHSYAFAELTVYPPLEDRRFSTTYSMTVNEQAVPVQRYNGNSYAWFAFSGSALVKIRVNDVIVTYQLSPKRHHLDPAVNGHEMSFTLDQPRKLVLRKVNGLSEELFIFAESLESNPPILGSPEVLNVLDYGADTSGMNESRDAFQNAIDVVTGLPSGGVVYVPQGRYRISKTVFLKSNVHLYLAPGAVLEVPSGVDCCFGYASVLIALDCSNVKISGRGVIYGNGSNQSLFFLLLTTQNAERVYVEDILLLDGYTTALRLQVARNSILRNVKILSDSPGLSDGVDIESSEHVMIDDCFVYSTDDNIAIGAGVDPRQTVESTRHVYIGNSVFYQTRTGHTFYIAPHIAPPAISDITYDNNDIITVAGLIGIYPFGGVKIESVTFRNMWVEEVRDEMPISLWIGDCTSWGPQNCGQPAGVLGHIHGIRFENVTLENYGGQNSILQGYSSMADIKDVYFKNVWIANNLITDAAAAHLTINGPVSNVVFDTAGASLSKQTGTNGTFGPGPSPDAK